MEQEAFAAGLNVLVGSETTELIADNELKVLDPYPTEIKVVLEARTKKILGCLAIGDRAVEVVNLCSMLIRSDTPPEHLIRCRFVHPSPAEALQRCVKNAVTDWYQSFKTSFTQASLGNSPPIGRFVDQKKIRISQPSCSMPGPPR
jgi:pyridine nucleotide-disulfide oxidoreductase